MSKFSGRQGKGAMRNLRDTKRAEAEQRDAVSMHHRQGRRARVNELDRRLYFDATTGSGRKPVSR